MNRDKQFWWFIVSLLLIIPVVLTLSILGVWDAAWLVGVVGTLVVMAGWYVYIVVWDSKKVWPNTTAWQRFTNIITFKR